MPDHSSSMYYIAVLCPGELDKKITEFKLWVRDHFGCVVALKSPAHITLVPPFWMKNEWEQRLIITTNEFKLPPGNNIISLDGFSYFGRRVIFINVLENYWLNEIKSKAETYFNELFPEFIKEDDRPFHPHITVANRDIKPSAFDKIWNYFSNKDFEGEFKADKLSLLRLAKGSWEEIC